LRRSAGLNEALAAARAGGTLVVPKPDGTTGAYSMLEDITGVMARVSDEFRLPTGMTMRFDPMSRQVMQFQAFPAIKER
jgi:hypothetical protein